MTTAVATKAPRHADQRTALKCRRTEIAKRIGETKLDLVTAEKTVAAEHEHHGAASPAARHARNDASTTLAELTESLERVEKDIATLDHQQQHAADVGALVSLGEKVCGPTEKLRTSADAFADALAEVRPLLRQFASDAHALGVTISPTFVTGVTLEWELASTLYRVWPQLFSRPRQTQLYQNQVGDLVRANVATAVETARRSLNEETEQ